MIIITSGNFSRTLILSLLITLKLRLKCVEAFHYYKML